MYISRKISVDTDNSKAASVGFVLILINLLCYLFDGISITGIVNLRMAIVTIIFAIIIIAMPIVSAIWVFKIAERLNRNAILWSLFAFIFSPIALISIAFLDIKVVDEEASSIKNTCKAKYKEEEQHIISQNTNIGRRELDTMLAALKQRYDELLYNQLNNYYREYYSAYNAVNSTEKLGNFVVEVEEEKSQHTEENASYNTGKCPACGYPITEAMNVCPDCEIALR